jgi:hypothetical protein
VVRSAIETCHAYMGVAHVKFFLELLLLPKAADLRISPGGGVGRRGCGEGFTVGQIPLVELPVVGG